MTQRHFVICGENGTFIAMDAVKKKQNAKWTTLRIVDAYYTASLDELYKTIDLIPRGIVIRPMELLLSNIPTVTPEDIPMAEQSIPAVVKKGGPYFPSWMNRKDIIANETVSGDPTL